MVPVLSRYNLTPNLHNRSLTPELEQIVLTRVAGGDTVRDICLELGIGSQKVYQKAYDNPDFKVALRAAQEVGSHSRVDYLTTIAADPTLPVDRAKLLIDAIKWVESRRNAKDYGDKVQHDVRSLTINLPPDLDGLF